MNCIFCTKKASRGGEHIWPDRLAPDIRKYLPPETTKTWSYASFESSVTGRVVKHRNGNVYKNKVGCVCDDCNNRWMNNLDQAIYADIVQLIHGQRVTLGQAAIRQLAVWVAMKTMVGEQRNPRTAAFRPEHHANLYLTGQPPAGFHIHLGLCGHFTWANAWNRQPCRFSLAGSDDTLWRAITAWGLGQLIIFTEFCPTNDGFISPPPVLTIPLFPKDSELHWPPPLRLSSETVSSISTRYFPEYASAAEDELTWGDRPRGDPRNG